jgi:hypothetical protein
MTAQFTPVQSQPSPGKFPRRNAITAFMLTDSAVLATSESLNSSPIRFDEDNYSTLFGKISCPVPLSPASSDGNPNRGNFSRKRPLEKHHLESTAYNGSCNESDLRFSLTDALVESHLQGLSLPKSKKCRVSLREPEAYPFSFQVEKEN